MKGKLLGVFGLCCFALVCAISPVSAQDKGDHDITPNAPGTIHGGSVPVPESFSTLWLAVPVVGILAVARLRRKNA